MNQSWTEISARLRCCIVLVLLIGFCQSSVADRLEKHPVSVIRSSVYVTSELLTVRLEFFLEDLLLFHDLQPNEEAFLGPQKIEQGIADHQEFILERLEIRDVRGIKLAGRVLSVDRSKVPQEGVPLSDLMAHTITLELEYELQAVPEFLTISQQLTDEDAILPSEVNLQIKQQGSDEVQQAVLRPFDQETFRFKWDDDRTSVGAESERDSWLDDGGDDLLGITSYGSVYSFLYIDRYEVRHEILIPLLTLEESVLLARDEDEFLDLAEQDAARRQIEAYFVTGNPVVIDGKPVTPSVQRCDFYGLDFRDFAQQSEPRSVSLVTARVGIILSYPCQARPETLTLTWNRFNDFIWSINLIAFVGQNVQKVELGRGNKARVFAWASAVSDMPVVVNSVEVKLPQRSRFSLPLVSLSCLLLFPLFLLRTRGDRRNNRLLAAITLFVVLLAWPFARWEAPNPFQPRAYVEDEQADAIFAELHDNLYKAFQFGREEEIYDALAKTTDGDFLQDMYLQIRRGLQMQEQGGAVSRIHEVMLLDGKRLLLQANSTSDMGTFGYRCRWNVSGTVEHWGHIHARTNQYEALFSICPRGDGWKITSVELTDEKRVSFETKLRGV